MAIRLDKFLSEMGVGTRSEVKKNDTGEANSGK